MVVVVVVAVVVVVVELDSPSIGKEGLEFGLSQDPLGYLDWNGCFSWVS